MNTYGGGFERRMAFPPLTHGVKTLLIINFALWGVTLLAYLIDPAVLTGFYRIFGIYLPRAIYEPWFAFWQPLSYMFIHSSSPGHVLWNMIGLYFFGVFLEEWRGTREFLRTYFAGGLLGGALWMVYTLLLHGPVPSPLVGASGAVTAIIVAVATRFPRQEVWLFGMLPIQLWLIAVVLVALDLFPILTELRYGSAGGGVAHTAHLGGALLGFLSVCYQERFRSLCETFEDLPAAFVVVRNARSSRVTWIAGGRSRPCSTRSTAKGGSVPSPVRARVPQEGQQALQPGQLRTGRGSSWFVFNR